MKFATCNEPWKGVPIEEIFRIAARLGYGGVEIAPFTLGDDVNQISSARRREITRAAADAGIHIVGLHWLLVSPPGMHITTPDAALRRRTAEYIKSLVHFCADLGGKVMIHGSPKQRSIEPPTTFQEAWKRAQEVFADCAATCAERGVTICLEALGPKETNFINTAEEAARMADEIGHPNIDIMLDVKAMSTMPGGIVETVRRFGGRARHFHANEPCGKGIGMPLTAEEGTNVEMRPVLKALADSGYNGWVSVEPFDYNPNPTTVAEVGLRTLKAAIAPT